MNTIKKLVEATKQSGNTVNALTNGGGGSDLPAVTADDNGKVLTVVDGAWNKAEASGGDSGVFVARFTYDQSTGKYSCDKTSEEIHAAAEQGKAVLGMLDADEIVATYVQGEFEYLYVTEGVPELILIQDEGGPFGPTGYWIMNTFRLQTANG